MKPQFQIGDGVWRVQYSKAVEETITAVGIKEAGISSEEDFVFVYSTTKLSTGSVYLTHSENELFKSKEELIKAL